MRLAGRTYNIVGKLTSRLVYQTLLEYISACVASHNVLFTNIFEISRKPCSFGLLFYSPFNSYGHVETVSNANLMFSKYTQLKKLRKSQKTMQHKNTQANNYSIFIFLFRYMSSVEKNVCFSLLAPIPLL